MRGSDYRKTHIIFLHRKNGYKEPNVHCTLSMSHSFPPSLPPHQLRQEDKWEVVTTGRLILYFYTGRMATRNQMYTVHYLCHTVSLLLYHPTNLTRRQVRGSDYRKTHIMFLHRKNGYKEPNVHCTLSMSHSFPPSLPPHQLRQEDKWEVVTTGRLILYFYTGRMAT